MKDIYQEVEGVVMGTEKMLDPIRRSFFKRFPVVATLLVAFGMSATFFGIERIIVNITWLNERPFLILAFGIGALVVSGKLYQKLG